MEVVFRFQNGSIKRAYEANRIDLLFLFRFQNGSIKSVEPSFLCFVAGIVSIPKLVRLKAKRVHLHVFFFMPFRFQNGSIKS